MVEIQPTVVPAAPSKPLFYAGAGPLAIAAGILMVVGQAIWWPFDQQGNVATSQNNIFNAGSVVYLAGFCVLMFALIGVHGRQAHRAGQLGTFGFSAAVLGTMMLGGDLWFESFAVPWLAEGPLPEVLRSDSIHPVRARCDRELLALRYWLGIVRPRKSAGTGFPLWISIFVVVGGIAGYKALLSPWGIPLGVAMATLGVWLVRARRSPSTPR